MTLEALLHFKNVLSKSVEKNNARFRDFLVMLKIKSSTFYHIYYLMNNDIDTCVKRFRISDVTYIFLTQFWFDECN